MPGHRIAARAADGDAGFGATEVHQPEGRARATADGVKTVSFGRYRLVDLLGEGGMAQVYTAVTFGAEGFRRTFVVKRLRAELAREPAVVAQFIDEANLGSTLVHSNIIPVFDFGKVGDEYFLAQEYILGRDLGRLAARSIEKQQRALPPTTVLYAAAETLRALEYAHTKLGEAGRPMGIVHRDVSPSNILVSARGEVKLFDFGIVKAEGRVTKTQHGVVKGNVSFMSPEQARGIDIDGRADLFSLGLVIFYCLTGEVLYKGSTTYELLVKAATGPGADELARIDALPAPCAADRPQGAGDRPEQALPDRGRVRRRARGARGGRRGRGGRADEHAVRRGLPRRGGALRGRDPATAARWTPAHTRDFQNAAVSPSNSPPSPSPPHAGDRPGLLIAHVGPAEPIDEGAAMYRTRQPCRALGEAAGRRRDQRIDPVARPVRFARAAQRGRAGDPRRRRSRSASHRRRAPPAPEAVGLRDHAPPVRGAARRAGAGRPFPRPRAAQPAAAARPPGGLPAGVDAGARRALRGA